tara:strand:- start:3927 stop:5837 length:1911 start_codon:yes stop_codon:yes gene_type:complete
MAEDSQAGKKKIFQRIETLGNVGKAIDSSKDQVELQNLMGSYDSINKKSNNMLEYFLDLIQLTGGQDAVKRAKKKVVGKVTGEFRDGVKDILFEEFLRFTNCDLGFVIPSSDGVAGIGANDIKVDVKTIDPFGMLKVDPNTKVGSFMYEGEPLAPGFPYATNKELNARLANPFAPLTSYMGASASSLFDIEYDNVDSFIVKPRGLDGTLDDNSITANNDRKVTEFLRDYFDSIDVFGNTNFLATLFNTLNGVVDIQIPKGSLDVELEGKFGEIIKRLMGICGDDNSGADGGTISSNPLSRLSEGDDEDVDSFFAFGPQELRNLEDETSLKLKGLIRFATCDNIEGKMNVDLINNGLTDLLNEKDPAIQDMLMNQTLDDAINGLQDGSDFSLGLKLPLIGVDFDLNLLKKLPLILISLILTPKILLPLVIVVIALGGTFTADDILDLLKKIWSLVKRILKKIINFILEVLYEEIKRAIMALIEKIMSQILSERNLKTLAIIQSLLNILTMILETVEDFMNCKNVLNTLLGLVTIPPIPTTINIPQPLLFATALRPGFSDTRAFQNVLENFQKSGLNTEDHADGSPNQMVVGMYNMIKGVEQERTENSVVKVAIKPITVITPNGPATSMPGSGTGLVI